jgi:hypothetical protein
MARTNYAANPRLVGSDRATSYYEAGKGSVTAMTGATGLPVSYVTTYRRAQVTTVATTEVQFGQGVFTDRLDFPHVMGDFYWHRLYVRTNQASVNYGVWYVERSWNGAAYVNTASEFKALGTIGSANGWVEVPYLNYIHFSTTQSVMIIPVIQPTGVGFLPVGAQLDIAHWQMERENFTSSAYYSDLYEGNTSIGTYFDGSTAQSDTETFSWSGTTNLSISRSLDRWTMSNTGRGATPGDAITVGSTGGTAGTQASDVWTGSGYPKWSAFPDVLGDNRAMHLANWANVSWLGVGRKWISLKFRFMFTAGTEEVTLIRVMSSTGGYASVRITINGDNRFKIYDADNVLIWTMDSELVPQPNTWYKCSISMGAEINTSASYENLRVTFYDDDDTSPGNWLFWDQAKTVTNIAHTVSGIYFGGTGSELLYTRQFYVAEPSARGGTVVDPFFGVPQPGNTVTRASGSLDVNTRAFGENTTNPAPLAVVPATANAPSGNSLSFTLPTITNRALLVVVAYSPDFAQSSAHNITGITYTLGAGTPSPLVYSLDSYPIDTTAGGHNPLSEGGNPWTAAKPNQVGMLRWVFDLSSANSGQVFTMTRNPANIPNGFGLQVSVVTGVGPGTVTGFSNKSANTQYHGGYVEPPIVRDLAADALAGPNKLGLVEYQISLWEPEATMWPIGLWGGAASGMIAMAPYGMTPLAGTTAGLASMLQTPVDGTTGREYVINAFPGTTRGPYNQATSDQVDWDARISRAELEAQTGYFGIVWWSVFTVAVPIRNVLTGKLNLSVGLTGAAKTTANSSMVPTIGLIGGVKQEFSRAGSLPVAMSTTGRLPVYRAGETPTSVGLTAEAAVQSPLYLFPKLDHTMHFSGAFSVDVATVGMVPVVQVQGVLPVPASVAGRVPLRDFPTPKELDLIPVSQVLTLEPLPEDLDTYAVTEQVTMDEVGYWRLP